MELITVITVSVIVALINSSHVILQWIANKPGEFFTGIPHFFADYFLYVGALAQGASGRWIWAEHLFTNEPMAPTWYYWFYVTLGHIGSWIKLSPFATYNVSLIILVFLLSLIWYWCVMLMYPQSSHPGVRRDPEKDKSWIPAFAGMTTMKRLTTWIIILTTTNWYLNGQLLGQFWFSPSPVFARLGGVPYHAAQMILFILLSIIFSRPMESRPLPQHDSSSHGNMLIWFHFKKLRPLILLVIGNWKLVILAALAASANPVQMLLFDGSAILMMSLIPHVTMQRKISTIILLFLSGGAGAWMTYQEFARQAVFIAARGWELVQYAPNTLPNILLSVGPVLFFIPFGIRKVFNAKDPLRTLLVIWGLGSFALFLSPIPRLLILSPVRFLHPVPYAAALAILGAEGLFQLSHLLHRKLVKIIHVNTIRVVLIALYLLLTIPVISRQFIDRITPARNPQLLMDTIYNHVPAPITEALTWLKVTGLNPVSKPVVLVDPNIPIEVLVPVFTGLPSFSGHPIHTLYPDVKEAKRQEFFGGKMSAKDAAQFLKDHRIGFIVSTPARRLPVTLHKAFSNATISIYQ